MSTDGRYKYIRNFLPHLPWYHEMTRDYPRLQPTYQIWHQLARLDTIVTFALEGAGM
jgi:hypothetical protein